ncbi:MAG: MscL family protein [Patescibacteria group bacterium]
MIEEKKSLKNVFTKERRIGMEDLRKVKDAPKSFFTGLLQFLKEYSIIGLAIGVVVGQATKDLVDSMVKGFFMPIIELIVSKDKYENLTFAINDVVFDIGKIISSTLTFLIIMTILYLLIKKIMKNDNLLPKK